MALVVYVKDSFGVRKVELPDSREAFCASLNAVSAQTGIVASVTPFRGPRALPSRRRGVRKSGQRKVSRARS